MTLDETIEREYKIAEENQKIVDTQIVFDDVSISELYCDDTDVIEEHLNNYKKCAEYHKQIAEWLEDYKRLKSIPKHNYDNCHNVTCRRRCEKDGYDKAINNCKSVIDNAYIQEYIDGFTYAIITENYEQLKAGK